MCTQAKTPVLESKQKDVFLVGWGQNKGGPKTDHQTVVEPAFSSGFAEHTKMWITGGG